MLRFAWLLAGASAVTQTFYVCNDAGDLDFRGSYDLDEDTHANKPTWTNAQGKTIFAHGPFWYIGDLSPHPVETGYRGVVDCPRNADEPGDSDEDEEAKLEEMRSTYLPSEGETADWIQDEQSDEDDELSDEDEDGDESSASESESGWSFGRSALGGFLKNITGNKVLEGEDVDPPAVTVVPVVSLEPGVALAAQVLGGDLGAAEADAWLRGGGGDSA